MVLNLTGEKSDFVPDNIGALIHVKITGTDRSERHPTEYVGVLEYYVRTGKELQFKLKGAELVRTHSTFDTVEVVSYAF